MEKGVDIMGGSINRVFWDSLPEQQVDDLFEFAKKKNVDLDIHVDYSNNPVSFALPYVARKTIEYGFQGRVTVAHVVSLAAVPDRIALQTIEILKEAGITVCVLPIVIRVTRVKELVEAGVNVICGSDNIQDTWSGLGNADPLSMMFLLAHIAEMGSDHQLEKIFQMGTYNAAKALRINHDYGIEEGKNADLVVLEARSMPEAIRFQARKQTIIKRGRVLLHEGRVTEHMSDFA
jgi:cytosine deaminase